MNKDIIVNELKAYYAKTGKPPRYVDITSANGFSCHHDTVARAFGGSLTSALNAAGLQPYKKANSKRVDFTCESCGNKFHRTVLKAKQRKRMFCSMPCWLKFKKAKAVKQSCATCGKPISSGKSCRNVACIRKAYIASWKAGKCSGSIRGGYVATAVKQYLFEKYNSKCSRCGWSEVNKTTGKIPLTVEHIDGNSNNSQEANLDLICPNCHSLTSTYGALNKGHGRKTRRRYDVVAA